MLQPTVPAWFEIPVRSTTSVRPSTGCPRRAAPWPSRAPSCPEASGTSRGSPTLKGTWWDSSRHVDNRRVRRADRLFLLVQALRGRRAVPARRLAELVGVSLRTVYRDVADLQLSGMPIEGEAGVGYTLRRGAEVPPLMFTREELEALVVGARLTDAFAGRRLSRAARQALVKIEAVLPEDLRRRAERSRVFAPATAARAALRDRLDLLHEAVDARRVVHLRYATPGATPSERDVEPLCLAFWGQAWTLGAWCRARQDFRSFRLDRMEAAELRLGLADAVEDLAASRLSRGQVWAHGGRAHESEHAVAVALHVTEHRAFMAGQLGAGERSLTEAHDHLGDQPAAPCLLDFAEPHIQVRPALQRLPFLLVAPPLVIHVHRRAPGRYRNVTRRAYRTRRMARRR
jgi:predicted DNA-binding transcriptional regulator YafY